MGSDRTRALAASGLVALVMALAAVPALAIPAFYVSFLYIIYYWIALATSWTILSGFAGYWSFGHAAFMGVGAYAAATLAIKIGCRICGRCRRRRCWRRRSARRSASSCSASSACAASCSR